MTINWDAFMDAWHRGEWIVSTCDRCGHSWETPRVACPRCGSADATPSVAAGTGIVRGWTRVVHRFHHRDAGPPPFTVAVVDMDEHDGLVLIGEVVSTAGSVAVGDGVRLTAQVGADGVRRPAFAPAAV